MYKDTIMPYVMASMHPMMHMALLGTSLIFYFTEHKNFFEVPNAKNCSGTSKDFKDALNFINNGGKERLMYMMILAHVFSIVLHWAGECAINAEKHTVGRILILAKVFIYVMVQFAV